MIVLLERKLRHVPAIQDEREQIARQGDHAT